MLTGRPGRRADRALSPLPRISGSRNSGPAVSTRALPAESLHRQGKEHALPGPAPSASTNCEARARLRRTTPPRVPQSTASLGAPLLLSPSPPPHVTSLALSSSVIPGVAARTASPPTLSSHWLSRSRASGIAPSAPAAGPCRSPPAFSQSRRGGGSAACGARGGARACREPRPPPRASGRGCRQRLRRTRTRPPAPSAGSRVASRSRAAATAVAAFSRGARALRPLRRFPVPGRGREPLGSARGVLSSPCAAGCRLAARAPGGRYPPATVPAPRTRSNKGARARERRPQEGGAAAAIAKEGGSEGASERGWSALPGSRPSPVPSPPPAPRESRGAAGGGGGGGGGGSPRGRVRPAPRRPSSRRRLSRRWTRSSRTWRRGRRRRSRDPGGRGRVEGAQLVSARARGPRRRGRAPPRCGVQGEAGTAGPRAREQWRSWRGRGGSGPPAPWPRRPLCVVPRPGPWGPPALRTCW